MLDLCVDVISDLTSCRDAKALGLIVFVLGSVLCFRNRFHLSAPQSPSGPRCDSTP